MGKSARNRREERQANRKRRREGRKHVARLMLDLHEDGDDTESLGEKVRDVLVAGEFGEDRPFLDWLLKVLLKYLPIFLKCD